MDEFWKTPTGKILGNGVHDHAGGLSLAGANIYIIEILIKNGELTNEELIKRLESIKKALKVCKESMDYIYTGIKDDSGKS